MKYKDIPRRKFTDKQIEFLEKLNWLAKQTRSYSSGKFSYFEICEKWEELYDKIDIKLGL